MNLKEIRMKHGVSAKELSSVLGISASTVSMYESGKRQPDIETLKKIADYFHISMDFLLGRTQPEPLPEDLAKEANKILVNVPGSKPHVVKFEQQKKPTNIDGLDAALIDALTGLSDAETQRVLDFVSGMKARTAVRSSPEQSDQQ